MFVIKYVSTNYPLFLCVTNSSLCELTVTADKRLTVQSTVVTKTCLSLISCSTIHKLSILHAWECDAMTQNIVKRVANQNCVNCLFDMIGQSNMSSFSGTEKNICLRHRDSVRNEEDIVQFRL